jgi:hypothetical protein
MVQDKMGPLVHYSAAPIRHEISRSKDQQDKNTTGYLSLLKKWSASQFPAILG